MQSIDVNNLIEFYGAAIPLSILLIENDEDRQFLSDMYLNYRGLMFKVAVRYFPRDLDEIEEAVSNAVEKLCKKHLTLMSLECNKIPSYIVSTCKRVCITRIREIIKQRESRDYVVSAEIISEIPSDDDVQSELFTDLTGEETLAVFPDLNEKDKNLIMMRHVELLDYIEIAEELNITEGAARTAVSRARSKLIKLADEKKWNGEDE